MNKRYSTFLFQPVSVLKSDRCPKPVTSRQDDANAGPHIPVINVTHVLPDISVIPGAMCAVVILKGRSQPRVILRQDSALVNLCMLVSGFFRPGYPLQEGTNLIYILNYPRHSRYLTIDNY